MNPTADKTVFLTAKAHKLLKEQAEKHEVKMEALAHAALVLSLTDASMTQRAVEFARYQGNDGAKKLEQRDL
ncbi:MAG: hypothetical protein ACLQGP_32445 [Isosphaeraceae bacterium]